MVDALPAWRNGGIEVQRPQNSRDFAHGLLPDSIGWYPEYKGGAIDQCILAQRAFLLVPSTAVTRKPFHDLTAAASRAVLHAAGIGSASFALLQS
jgi:hypothetical protein